jgi:phage tail protein X
MWNLWMLKGRGPRSWAEPGAVDLAGLIQKRRLYLLLAAVLVIAPGARATVWNVTNTSDNAADTASLRFAVNHAQAGDTITFDSALNGQTITLDPGNMELQLNYPITIQGPGASLLAISGGNKVPVFFIANTTGTVTISGLTITEGWATTGGGVYADGTALIENCIISNNSAFGYGGGIYVVGTSLTVSQSTITGNSALNGGGIAGWPLLDVEPPPGAATLVMNGSTVSGNRAERGGGLLFGNATLRITFSTLAHNTSTVTPHSGEVYGTFVEGCALCFANIIVEPAADGLPDHVNFDVAGPGVVETTVGPLADNGGPTPTILPLPGSPAICAGTRVVDVTTPLQDQRGFPRTNTTYPGYSTSKPCIDSGAVQTNYQSAQFTNGPYSADVNQAVSPAPLVSVTESGQNIGGVPVTLIFSGNGTATGLGPVTTVAGTGATFSGLQVSALGSDTLSVSIPVVGSYTLTAGASLNAPAMVVVSSGSPQSAAANAAFGQPLTALVEDAHGDPVPNATLTFTAPGNGASATLSTLNAITDARGLASVTATANGIYGSYAVTASVAGVAAPASFSLTNLRVTPTITWTAPAAIPYGTPLSATQLSASSGGVPGTFVYSPAAGTLLSAGNDQTLSVTFTPADTNFYNTASGSTTISVTPIHASVSPNPNSKTYGAADPNPVTTGTLSGFLPSDNVTATYTRVAGEAPGTYSISATLSPQSVLANYTIATNPASFTILPGAAGLPPNQTGAGTYGASATLSVTITPVSGGVTPTGSVTFSFPGPNNTTEYICSNGSISTTSCPVPLNASGTAAVSPVSLPGGLDNIVVTYSGDTNYTGGGTTMIAYTVTSATTKTVLTISPNNNLVYGNTVTLTANVSDVAQNSTGTPTGPVQFSYSTDGVNWTNIGSPVTLDDTGAASLQTEALPAGTDMVKVVYTSDGNFAGSSVTVNQAVALKPLTITGLSAQDKTYDGTTAATITGTPSLVGVVTGDNVTLSGAATGAFADPNVGTAKTVTVASLTLAGLPASNYTLTLPAVTAAITRAAASVNPNAASKTYGADDPAFNGTLTGFIASDSITATYSRNPGETVAGSPYTISAVLSPAGTLGNYNITYNTAAFTINKANATVTPDTLSKTYGATDPALTGMLTGFRAADNVTATYNRLPGETVAGSPYAISAALSPAGMLGNYNITYNTANFTINKANASVTPNTASKTYGTSDPALSGTLTGFVAADTVTATYSRIPGETVGSSPYTVSATLSPAGVLGNYNISYNTAAFTINKANASVTPNAASKTYGTTDPAFSGTFTGFLPADSVSATYSRTAGETVLGSPYAISATLSPVGVLGNYDITYNTAAFTINKANASVTPNAASKTYSTSDPAFSGTLTGFVAADSVTATYSRTAGETVAGSPYTISAALSPAGVLGNYNVTYNTAGFTINKATASVTPNAASKTYGTADPALTGTLSGFVASDNVIATYSRTAGESVGGSPYTISAALTANPALANYNVTLNTANFAISKANASVTPNGASKTYGSADPALSGTLTDFLAADNVTATYSRTAGESVGGSPYTISAALTANPALANYNVTLNTANFAISKANASVTPNGASKTYGSADPALSGTLTGFLAADNVTAAYSRTAGESVPGSPYTISAALSANPALANYNVTLNTANFTITKANASVTPAAATKVYGSTDPAFSGTTSGFLAADSVTATYSRAVGETVAGSPYTISAVLATNPVLANYNVTLNTANFTITKANASVTPAAATKVYGSTDPAFSGTTSGFLAADSVAATYSRAAGETVTGSPYAISAILSPAGVLGNYNISYNTANFTITKLNASVTPNPASKMYGTAEPAFTGTLSGFLSADSVTATYSRTAGETVAGSPYAISAILNPASVVANYNVTYNPANFTITKATPVVTWNAPAAIVYTTPLSATQLNATANVPGTFVYTPAAGTVLQAGANQVLSATFTPTDSSDYAGASVTTSIKVTAATPVITWNTPAPITQGVALSGTQLHATANVAGTFVYSPPAGTVLGVGTQTLSATFTPADTLDYTGATASVSITVNPSGNFTLSSGQTVTVTGGNMPGNVTVVSGSTLILNNTTATKNITLSSGGTLQLSGSTVSGNIQANSGGDITMTGGSVGGNVTMQGGLAVVQLSGATIKGNVNLQNLSATTAQSSICGLTVTGNFDLQNSGGPMQIGSATPACPGNSVDGNMTIQNNTAAISAVNNQMTGNLTVQGNTGTVQVIGNNVGKNLDCSNDTSISGSGNTARQKQGQCTNF